MDALNDRGRRRVATILWRVDQTVTVAHRQHCKRPYTIDERAALQESTCSTLCERIQQVRTE